METVVKSTAGLYTNQVFMIGNLKSRGGKEKYSTRQRDSMRSHANMHGMNWRDEYKWTTTTVHPRGRTCVKTFFLIEWSETGAESAWISLWCRIVECIETFGVDEFGASRTFAILKTKIGLASSTVSLC